MASYKVADGQTSIGIVLDSNEFMDVYSGGLAIGTVISDGGALHLSGGVAINTILNAYGNIYASGLNLCHIGSNTCSIGEINSEGLMSNVSGLVLSGGDYYLHVTGTAKDISIAGSTRCSATMYLENGGVASNAAVRYNGIFNIHSGATANQTTLAGGNMYVAAGGSAVNTNINYGYMTVNAGTANGTVVNSGHLTLSSGTVANSTTVNASGIVYISSSGGVVMNGVTLTSGGAVNGVNLSKRLNIQHAGSNTCSIGEINSEGLMSNVSGLVLSGGDYYLHVTGTAKDISIAGSSGCSATMYLENGGVASNAAVRYNGIFNIHAGATANQTTLAGGSMYVAAGGSALNISANNGIMTIVGGYVSNTVLTSTHITLSSGAVAANTVISGGRMYIEGTHKGTFHIENDAWIETSSKCIIDFTVADRTTADSWLINDLAKITGTPTYTITVSADQESGTYKLAQGAGSFNKTVTIGDGTVDYGSITVNGDDLVYNGMSYSLDKVNGELTLTIKADVADNDLDGNGLADTVLVHTKQGYSGAWMTTGTSSVIKWGNLGNVNEKVELVGMGNVKGTSTNGSDIIMKIGTTIAAWVTDSGKVKSYKELYTLKSNMNMLGIGDFDRDGVTDYLLRSKTGDLGYVTGDDNKWHYIKGLGTEWKIAAVGDLDGNGTDDVIVRHDAGFTGAYMIDTNGKITWSNLDTLKSDMTLVGTGDFNGDGVDDVLLQNKSNGWVGAWLVEDGRVDSFIGLCNNKNTIEQIADFNGDGIDDLRIRTDKGDIGVLYVKGADTTEWKYFQSVGKEWDTSFALIS